MGEGGRLGRAAAVALATGGVALLVYAAYGVWQATGALVWFVPRLKDGPLLVAAVALPWLGGAALLWAAGGEAVRDGWHRRVPSRRWLTVLALGAAGAGAPGLLWWGWLPFALANGEEFLPGRAGPLIHVQFVSALVAATLYFVWSRRLQPSGEPLGHALTRGAIVAMLGLGTLSLWMHEPQPSGSAVYNGKTAVEWARQCQAGENGQDMAAWTRLERMGTDGEPGWRWLIERETGLGGRFASAWVVWLQRQAATVYWYEQVFLDDGLAMPSMYRLQHVPDPSPAAIATLRRAMRDSLWGLPAREAPQRHAALALSRMGPVARPAFFELLDFALRTDRPHPDGFTAPLPNLSVLRTLGDVGLDQAHPRRTDALERLRAAHDAGGASLSILTGRVLIQMDPGGPFGGPALDPLASGVIEPGGTQSWFADELEHLGAVAAPVTPRLLRELEQQLGDLHPPFEFEPPEGTSFDAYAVWRALLKIAPPAELEPVVLAALRHERPGPRVVAARALRTGALQHAELPEAHRLAREVAEQSPDGD